MSIDNSTADSVESDNSDSFEKNIEDIVLGYIIFGQDSSSGWTGAVMLTDARTRPLHFGFATPVRPGTLQRLLYGSTLEEYVKVDVIAAKLLRELPRLPDIMFVDKPEMISVRRIVSYPVASLTKSPSDGAEGSSLSIYQYSTGENEEDRNRAGALIGQLETHANLVDPFARMTEALKEALKEAQKAGRG